ncbi:Gfo/Idh/MocA family protein [Natrinema versiforme]|uniref:Gfo/Idh/MocA family oxidoreductase n=1 Tax=Natrinema versiforme TaxID=88724 RepID=A0A4V1FXE9_9EURY|nr:Gfo/Idh/MocA family oxidoreductase [Natrinema versiforme]QCS40950.1 Gfo/Idh/MocA family oxidoreductase [Natrinema versiforme]
MDFGVLSTAGIAQKAFLPGIAASDHDVTAIASRDEADARAVAAEYGIEETYGDYGDLIANADVDALYVPLPNSLHAEWTKRGADAGLDVLCEKPLAVDAAEAREVVDYCQEQGVTLMEAFMYQYHPRTERAFALARDELEDVRSVTATFKYRLDRTEDIRLSPELAGGSLMDVGCYAVSVVRQALGEPERAYATAADTRDAGVDTELTGVLEYADGVTGRVSSGFDTEGVQRYRIEATNGWVEVQDAFDIPEGELSLEYRIDGRHGVETFAPVDQFRLEIEHFADCVAAGRTPRTDGDEAIANMRVLDALSESAAEGRVVDLDS